MDVNRYYVPATKVTDENGNVIEKPFKINGSKFSQKAKLPTPQAFFERQKRLKEAEKKAMMRFATRRIARHNLHIRYDDLKYSKPKTEVVDELSMKITGTLPNGKTKPIGKSLEKRFGETDDEFKERQQQHEATLSAVAESRARLGVNGGLEPGANGFYLNKLSDAIEDDNEDEINKNVITAFFEQYAPNRLGEVDNLLTVFKGNEFELFKSLAKEYNIDVEKAKNRETRAESSGSFNSHNFRNGSANDAPSSQFVAMPIDRSNDDDIEPIVVDKKKDSPKQLRKQASIMSDVSSATKYNKKDLPEVERLKEKRGTRMSNVSRADSLASLSTAEPVTDEVKQFQKALDREIRSKLYTGEYVLSIIENSGRWWVNRDTPNQHPSQRRRNTLLDELRMGKVPISNATMSPSNVEGAVKAI